MKAAVTLMAAVVAVVAASLGHASSSSSPCGGSDGRSLEHLTWCSQLVEEGGRRFSDHFTGLHRPRHHHQAPSRLIIESPISPLQSLRSRQRPLYLLRGGLDSEGSGWDDGGEDDEDEGENGGGSGSSEQYIAEDRGSDGQWPGVADQMSWERRYYAEKWDAGEDDDDDEEDGEAEAAIQRQISPGSVEYKHELLFMLLNRPAELHRRYQAIKRIILAHLMFRDDLIDEFYREAYQLLSGPSQPGEVKLDEVLGDTVVYKMVKKLLEGLEAYQNGMMNTRTVEDDRFMNVVRKFEFPMQMLATTIPAEACVLELGIGSGATSIVVWNVLNNPGCHVGIEPFPGVYGLNRHHFTKEMFPEMPMRAALGILWKNGTNQTVSEPGEESLDPCEMRKFSLEDLEIMTREKITAIIADCRGQFPTLLKENPRLLKYARWILVKHDHGPKDGAVVQSWLKKWGYKRTLALAAEGFGYDAETDVFFEEIWERDVYSFQELLSATKDFDSKRQMLFEKMGLDELGDDCLKDPKDINTGPIPLDDHEIEKIILGAARGKKFDVHDENTPFGDAIGALVDLGW